MSLPLGRRSTVEWNWLPAGKLYLAEHWMPLRLGSPLTAAAMGKLVDRQRSDTQAGSWNWCLRPARRANYSMLDSPQELH